MACVDDRTLGTLPRAPAAARIVYVLEADPDVSGILREYGFESKSFSSLAALSEALRRRSPDAIIADLDVAGPEIGVTGIPMLFVSSRTDLEFRLRAVRSGGAGFLAKPPEAARIVERLETVLERDPAEPFRILIVENDRALAAHHSLILRGAGMEVRTNDDPRSVEASLVEFRPDLILMDLYLPEYSGLELASAIRQQDSLTGVPIMFLAAETRLERQLEAIRLGGDDFLTKPVDPGRLVSSVRSRSRRGRQIRRMMTRDGLTGLLNHTALHDRLRIELVRARRTGGPLSFAMIDVDRFKNVNDSQGHAAGDQVLRALGRMLTSRLRRTDAVGRHGGEEFGVVLPDTSLDAAMGVIEAVREAFEHTRHRGESGEFTVTFSAGLASAPPLEEPRDLVAAADRALYEAKRAGRNRSQRVTETQSRA